ncbi:MAG: ZIP family metal transporter [Candidatus Kerfeldbacteria bacterium]|nr:ZIP family metal transporter [Candidatus Kerfeldbacteria bacterium]
MTLATVLLVTTATSLAGLAGGFLLLWKGRAVARGSLWLVSFAAGSLLAAAFLDLLPEALSESDEPVGLMPWVLGGLLLFFLIEKFLLFHHHMHRNEEGDESSTSLHHDDHHAARRAILRPLIIFGDAIHNFLDGVIIAATFLVEPAAGFAVALAVFFHELPQEIGDFGILLHSGMQRRRIALWNVLGALVSPIGALIGYYALESFGQFELPLIAAAAGGFIYIAGSDLIPEINHEARARNIVSQVLMLLVGIAAIWLVGRVLPE